MSDRGTCRSRTRRRSHLLSPPRIFWRSGSRHANSTTRWSRNGARTSRLGAHAGPVDLRQDVVGKVAKQIQQHHPIGGLVVIRLRSLPRDHRLMTLPNQRRWPRPGGHEAGVHVVDPAELETDASLCTPIARDRPPDGTPGEAGRTRRRPGPTRGAGSPQQGRPCTAAEGMRDARPVAPELRARDVAVVPAEDLVAAVARKRHRHRRRASSRHQEGRESARRPRTARRRAREGAG